MTGKDIDIRKHICRLILNFILTPKISENLHVAFDTLFYGINREMPLLMYTYTGCGRNNSHILKVNKNQTKQGTQKILLFIKSTYDAIFFKDF